MLTMGNTRKKRSGLGKKLTDLRDRLGLNQKEAAEKCGVELRTWGRWERGEVVPHPAFQLLIRKAFGEF